MRPRVQGRRADHDEYDHHDDEADHDEHDHHDDAGHMPVCRLVHLRQTKLGHERGHSVALFATLNTPTPTDHDCTDLTGPDLYFTATGQDVLGFGYNCGVRGAA